LNKIRAGSALHSNIDSQIALGKAVAARVTDPTLKKKILEAGSTACYFGMS
jgi:hypothetical protein